MNEQYEPLQKYLEITPPFNFSHGLKVRLVKVIIMADALGYIRLYEGERHQLWQILGGRSLYSELLYGFRLTNEGGTISGAKWFERKLKGCWGVSHQIT